MNHNIRNFVIIAHIDHGKSTLADRMLEITGTVEARKMKAQYLDQLELERERGITVKMAPVRMLYHPKNTEHRDQNTNKTQNTNNQKHKCLGFGACALCSSDSAYTLNLIDTPGHSDFSYEVSRALAAVEGAILLVDATQGIQAQTLANFRAAKKAGLSIIGAVNKVDLFKGDSEELTKVISSVAELLDAAPGEIFKISAKTGEGVSKLLEAVVELIPPPDTSERRAKALIFDSFYENHKGVVLAVRLKGGRFEVSGDAYFKASGKKFKIRELGNFLPQLKPTNSLENGFIGYIATGLKDPDVVKIGDTLVTDISTPALPGYKEPKSSVFVSFYPEDADEYEELGQGFKKLKLNDSSLFIENDRNEILGRGYKVGFLGKLHYEITEERLRQEFNLETIQTFPSVLYKIKTKDGFQEITRPEDLPADYLEIHEPIIQLEVILPSRYVSDFSALAHRFRIRDMEMKTIGASVEITAVMPLQELMSDFDDKLKSVTEGFGSFSYEFIGFENADVVRMDILVSQEMIPGLSRFVPKSVLEKEARVTAERLKELLPKRQIAQPIQVTAGGRVVAREDVRALKKNVTGHLYGGDRTRKMKLWQKQKKGKKKLKEIGGVKIGAEVFRELLKK